jgi:GNAT superfamily N-acetyltransferase
MREADVEEARRIFRVAFGTFIGAPDPESFWLDRDFVGPRWRANPSGGVVAEVDGTIAGSNLATNWGSVGFFGPLTIRPDRWNQGIAQRLLGPTLDLFAQWGVRAAGLFTFSHSPKHIGLYQKFGFWPGYLTAMMSKDAAGSDIGAIRYSALEEAQRKQALDACRRLTDSIFEGLDVTAEIRAVAAQGLGDTLLLWGGDTLDAFAVCHCGEGTEAGSDMCFIKFAAARPDGKALPRILAASEALAAERGLRRMQAGVNLGRRAAYRQMLEHGFRIDALGVAMHRPDSAAYNRQDVFVVDDWR